MISRNEELFAKFSLFSILLVLVLSFVVALPTFAWTAGTANAQAPTGSISGTVFESDGTTPIVGAVVFVNDFVTPRFPT